MMNAYICSKLSIMINIRLLAHKGASDSVFLKGKEKLLEIFPGFQFELYSPEPDVLVFLSGGSELEAARFIKPGKFYLLAAFDENNSYAAACEVKALMDQKQIPSLLTDLHEVKEQRMIKRYLETMQALRALEGKTVGLIGHVSNWLLASTIDGKLLKSKFGIKLKQINWEDVPSYTNYKANADFIKKYHYENDTAVENAAKVHEVLKEVINNEKLDALTIECFSLVQHNKVTACLSLSQLNDQGIPAGCEGDICSITGMMLINALTGTIPWMANLIKVCSDCVRFAHCTAPTNLLDNFEVDTHFETGLGTAIAGKFSSGNITIFRINNTLSKAFVSEGTIISTHKAAFACRTQIEVTIPEHNANSLKHHPLGNHHLIIPGNHAEVLMTACEICGVKVIRATN